jgi:hypothetical protein
MCSRSVRGRINLSGAGTDLRDEGIRVECRSSGWCMGGGTLVAWQRPGGPRLEQDRAKAAGGECRMTGGRHQEAGMDQSAASPGSFRLPYPIPGAWTVLAALIAVAGAVAAAAPLLTRFSAWDDEGHMLLMFAHYSDEGQLYTRTFSEYGPFYFYAQSVFFQLLHWPLTHDMGRLVTLIYWVTSSLLGGAFAFRVSASPVLAAAIGLCVMLASRVIVNEPGHPQQVVLLLFMIAAYFSVPSASGRYYLRLFLLGGVGAALAFTKVNVGVFYVAALAQTLICLLSPGRLRSTGLGLTMIYVAAVPWLLMHGHFDRGSRGYFALATISGISTFAWGALSRPDSRFPVRAALCSGMGLLAGLLLIVAATSLQGVTTGALFWGVVLNPPHHIGGFFYPMYITRANVTVALVLTIGTVVFRLSADHLEQLRSPYVLRCVVGVGAVLALTWRQEIQWVVPLLPLTLMPRRRSTRGSVPIFTRLFITSLAMTQFVEPFPVAGSQLGIAAAPMILWACLCIVDGIDGLAAGTQDLMSDAGRIPRWDAIIGGAILFAAAGMSVGAVASSRFPPASSGLKGSTWLRLPADQAHELESVAAGARANCDMLFTMPGMGSFNMWSGVPSPNGWNINNWMRSMDAARQSEILSVIAADPRVCVILNREIMLFWDDDAAGLASSRLASYITNDMLLAAKFGGYEIRVSPYRISPWVDP